MKEKLYSNLKWLEGTDVVAIIKQKVISRIGLVKGREGMSYN
jgi:hypothetical protein